LGGQENFGFFDRPGRELTEYLGINGVLEGDASQGGLNLEGVWGICELVGVEDTKHGELLGVLEGEQLGLSGILEDEGVEDTKHGELLGVFEGEQLGLSGILEDEGVEDTKHGELLGVLEAERDLGGERDFGGDLEGEQLGLSGILEDEGVLEGDLEAEGDLEGDFEDEGDLEGGFERSASGSATTSASKTKKQRTTRTNFIALPETTPRR
jgi:hypothetical protein